MENLKLKEIYVVICKNNKIQDWTGIGVSQECYVDMEKAIEFCESKLNKIELEKNRKMQKRKLLNWFEFIGNDYTYEIKVLNVK